MGTRSAFVIAALAATGVMCNPAMAAYNSEPVTLPPILVPGFTGFINLSINSPGVQFVEGPTGLHGNVVYSPANTAPTAKRAEDKNGCANRKGEPIEISSGSKVETDTFFTLPGEMGLRYELYYTSLIYPSTGRIQSTNLDYTLDLTCNESDGICRYVTFTRPDGSQLVFSGNPKLLYGNFPVEGGNSIATLTHNSDGTWTLHDEDTTVQSYTPIDSSGDVALTAIKDVSGIGWTISRTSGNPSTETVTHTDGRSFTVSTKDTIDAKGFTTAVSVTVTDPAGNVYAYTTNPYGAIISKTLPGIPQTVVTYTYSNSVYLTGVEYNGAPYSYTSYDSGYRANGTRLADGSEATSIVYAYPSANTMTATITNPLGHTSVSQYNWVGGSTGPYYQLASVSDSAVQDCAATEHYRSYDGNGNLTKTIDNNGVTHTYSYAIDGQLQTETEASGTSIARTTNYVWDPNQQLNRLLSVAVAGESKTSYAYNAQNRIASVTHANLTPVGTANQSLTTTYAYALYPNGMVQTMTVTAPSPGGTDKTTCQYDTHGNVTSITDGLGHATTYTSYNALGEPGLVTGSNGDVTDYTYDARGRVTSKTTHPNGGTATWTYAYDSYGLLAKVTAPDGEMTTWTRNAEMRVTSISHNDKDGTSAENFGYNANGDVISDVVKRGTDIGKSQTFVYDGLGRLYQAKGGNGQLLAYAYDGNGNVLSVTDALGHKTRYAYDALNRVIGITNATGGITSYAYDAGDHVTGVEEPRGLVTSYAWDGLGQLWQQVSPDTGITTFSHDTYGRLASETRASGNHIAYAYDTLNRVISVAATNTLGTITRSFTWDTCPNGIGRLCSAVHVNDDTVSYSYTPEGWIAARNFSFVSGINYALGYSYDNMGHLASVTYPDGNQALYDYSLGAVADVRVKIGAANSYAATSVVYRPMDLAMSSWISSNGLTNGISYDTDLRPTSITASGAQSLAFTYDAANRINHVANGMDGTLTQTYTYDAMSRLTGVTSTADNESFAYDADGNRTLHVWDGSDITFTMDTHSNRLVSTSTASGSTTYGYDADGNTLTANGNTLFGYGGFGLVVGANGYMSYANGAEGQRLRNTNTVARTQTYFAPDRSGVPMAEDQAGLWLD